MMAHFPMMIAFVISCPIASVVGKIRQVEQPHIKELIADFEMSTSVTRENQEFYKVSYLAKHDQFQKRWVDIDRMLRKDVVSKLSPIPGISNSHRKGVFVDGFELPIHFYGVPVKKITINTGGFVYLGDEPEKRSKKLAQAQYIAPLMADFATNASSQSMIKYLETASMVVIEWTKVTLNSQKSLGYFTFQLIFRRDGEIVVLYKQIPVPYGKIGNSYHPKFAALSDAYVETGGKIVEYHKVLINTSYIASNNVILLEPLPSCMGLKSCAACTSTIFSGSNCVWCSAKISNFSSGFCSDSLGRHRWNPEWKLAKCDKQKRISKGSCPGQRTLPVLTTGTTTTLTTSVTKPTTTEVTTTTIIPTVDTSTSAQPMTGSMSSSLPIRIDVLISSTNLTNRVETTVEPTNEEGIHASTVIGISLGGLAVVFALMAWVIWVYGGKLGSLKKIILMKRPDYRRQRNVNDRSLSILNFEYELAV